MPRLRVAARAGAAAPRAGGALRVGILDPAYAPTRSRSRPAGVERDSPTSTRGPRSSCRARAGSASTRPAGLLAGEGHIPLACTPTRTRRPPSPASSRWTKTEGRRQGRRDLRLHDVGASGCTSPARHQAVHRRAMERDRRARPHGRPALAAGDVRLTMGGEPTFVVDRRPRRRRVEHDALGPTKRRLRGRPAPATARPLRARTACSTTGRASGIRASRCRAGRSAATGAATACRSGKTRALSPTTRQGLRPRRRRGAGVRRGLAARLGRRSGALRSPAYEDAWYYLGESGGCRSTSTRSTKHLDDPEERARLARGLRAGARARRRLRAAAAARVRRRRAGAGQSGRWFLRSRAHVPDPRRLADGLSAAARLAAVGGARGRDAVHRARPVRAARAAAARARASRRRVAAPCRAAPEPADPSTRRPRRRTTPSGRVRRPGRRPHRAVRRAARRPAARLPAAAWRLLEDYLDLVAAVEAPPRELEHAGRDRGLPAARRSAASNHFKITPDPGVIEVNIQPAHSWDELVENTTTSCTRRRAKRGSAPRSSCSTAGTPARAAATTSSSAARRRRQPDPAPAGPAAEPASATGTIIRRSRICSPGMFVGPTSQAPRVDEARNDSLYELEIAFTPDSPSTRGAPPALARRSRLPPPARRRDRQHAPRRVLHRQALLARQRAAAGTASSSCASSRCRRTRG